jgi:uncharacterized protein (TIGR02246 family)
MRRIALVIAFVAGLIAPAFAQRAEIEAVNAKWMDFFNKGDFAGVASLYTEDATAFPPGSGMVKGRAAIEAMWKSMSEQVSDPKVITLDVKPLGPSAAREIGTFSLKTKGSTPQEVTGKYVVVWEMVGSDWKLATDIWNTGNSHASFTPLPRCPVRYPTIWALADRRMHFKTPRSHHATRWRSYVPARGAAINSQVVGCQALARG